MLEMRVDRVLSAIVEHVKKGGRTNEALHFHLDVRLHQDDDSVKQNQVALQVVKDLGCMFKP